MTLRERVAAVFDYVAGKTVRATTSERPAPPLRLVNNDDAHEISVSLRELVAWQMYQHGMPLDHVKAADPTGRVAAAIEALAADMLAQQQAEQQAAAAQAEERFEPAGKDWSADTVYYDRVRRLADAMGLPVDDLSDLDALAKEYQWTPESIVDDLAARGLEP